MITERQDGLLIVGTEGRALEVESARIYLNLTMEYFQGAFTRQVHQHQRGQRGEVQPDGHPSSENKPHLRGRLQLFKGTGEKKLGHKNTKSKRVIIFDTQMVPSYHNDVFWFYAHTSFVHGQDNVQCLDGHCRHRFGHSNKDNALQYNSMK